MKVLDKTGLPYLWSAIKGWAGNNLVPLTRTINGKAISSNITNNITFKAEDIPYSATETVKDKLEPVRNVKLSGDTVKGDLYSTASQTFVGQNTDVVIGTAPGETKNLITLKYEDSAKEVAAMNISLSSSNNTSSKITLKIHHPVRLVPLVRFIDSQMPEVF